MRTCGACGSQAPDDARFCPACAAPLESEQGTAERKLATLIFADLVGSTALAGSSDPERTRAMLERFYEAMADEISIAGGTVEKFAGDAVMAAFGVPAALEDHAERALHAALAMQRRLAGLGHEELSLRIGVNSGDVVVGIPRAGSSFVSGDPVNVAARLEQGAEPGQILVGERTVGLARGAFEFGERRSVDAKGKPGGVMCRPLVRALTLMRPRGVHGLRRAFVGRDDELRTLEQTLEESIETATPRLVTILGDAGVGKTRLVREFWERLGERDPEPLRRTGRCLSYGEGVTYWPLGEVLREHLGLAESDPAERVMAALEGREMLGLTLGLDVAHDLHPLVARDRLQDAWVDFCSELASDRPVVMLIEDIHWAEDLLLDLLERIVTTSTGPLLVLATARPEVLESRPGWGARLPGVTISLEALTPDGTGLMLDELLGDAVPEGVRDLVIERAEGNPFFVEEVIGTLIDLGLLTHGSDGWRLADLPPSFSVPDTVQAVVAARVDLLEAADKQGLQAASVIGRIFWAGPVYELVTDGEPDLQVIEQRDFIRRRSGSSIPDDREYAIKHAVTREVAYASLPTSTRARMHAVFARWLERIGTGRNEFASLLAHHYAEAVRPEDVDLAWAGADAELEELRRSALTWLRQAASLAIGRMEIDDGVSLLHRAVALESDPGRRAQLWHTIGNANILRYDGEAFWTAMQTSLETVTDDREAAEIYADLALHTAVRSGMWKTRPSEELIEGWIARALELAEDGARARARALLAHTYVDPEDASAQAEEALSIAETLDDVELRSFAFDAFAGICMARGEFEQGYEWSRKRLDLVPQLTDPDHVSLVYGYSSQSVIGAGRIEEARELAVAYDEVTRRLSPHHRLHAAYGYVSTEANGGRWDRVLELAARMEAAVDANAGTPCALENLGLLLCALAHVHAGNDAEARRLQAVVDALGKKGFNMRVAIEIDIAIARRDMTAVARLLEDWEPLGLEDYDGHASQLNGLVALERWPQIDAQAPILVIEGSYIEPFALRALGLARDDDELIDRAIAKFDAMELDWFARQTEELREHRR